MQPLSTVCRGFRHIKTVVGRLFSKIMSSPSPMNPPANKVLFQSTPGNTLHTGGTPSAILDNIRGLCQVTGRDLSKESRITKIEYCKSAKSPFHEYLLIHITYVSEGKSYPQFKSVALVERTAHGHRRLTPGSGSIASSLFAAASTTSVVTPPPQLRADALRSSGSLSLASSMRSSSSSFDTPADDFIAVYPDGKVNKGRPKYKATMRFKEGACLSFEQLACIVEVVHELAPKYRLISTQCYWFSICVWATICHILGDGVEYNKHEMQEMGKWARDSSNGHHVSLRITDEDGKGRFLLQGEDAGSAVAAYERCWSSWEEKFIAASQIMAAKDKEIAALRAQVEANTANREVEANRQKPSN